MKKTSDLPNSWSQILVRNSTRSCRRGLLVGLILSASAFVPEGFPQTGPPTTLAAVTPGNEILFHLHGVPDETYLIQASTDLKNWIAITTSRSDSEGVITFTDTQTTKFESRFFRGLRATVSAAGGPPPSQSFTITYDGLGVGNGEPVPDPYPGITAATVTHFGRTQNGVEFQDVSFWNGTSPGNGYGDLSNVAVGPRGTPSQSGLSDPAWGLISITPVYPDTSVRLISFDLASFDDNDADETIGGIVVTGPPPYDRTYWSQFGVAIAGDNNNTTHTHVDFAGGPVEGLLNDTLTIWWEASSGRVAVDNIKFEIVGSAPEVLARNDFYSVPQGGTLTVAAPGVLGNDVLRDDTGPLSASLDNGPEQGALDLTADGGFSYSPKAGFAGMDGFIYVAKDAQSHEGTGVALISVLPPGALFYDDFARPAGFAAVTPWEVPRANGAPLGTWTISDDIMQATSVWNNAGYAYVSNNWTDYAVEVRASMPTNGYGWMVGGRVNPVTGDHYGVFLLPYGHGGTWVLRLVKYTGWDEWSGATLGYQPDVPVPGAGTPDSHALRMTFIGNRILVHWDSEQVMDVTDNNWEGPVYQSGGIAVGMYTGTNEYAVTFEDVLVSEVRPAAETYLVTVTRGDGNATEAGEPGTFVISRAGGTRNSLTVSYELEGTAQNGLDYESLSGSVTLPTGSESVTVSVRPVDDALVEGDETVFLTAVPDFTYQVGVPNRATLSIGDNDEPPTLPTVTITAADEKASESGETGELIITRTGSTASALTVPYSVTGTALNGTDYENLSGSISIPVGSASATVRVTPIDDLGVEADETVTLTLLRNAAYATGSPDSGTVVIASDDPLPAHTLKFYLHGHDVPGTAGGFTMNQDPASAQTLTLKLANATSWFSEPTLTGTFQSNAAFSVVMPGSLALQLAMTVRLAATNPDGSGEQLLGQTTQTLGLGLGPQTIRVPVTAPLTFNNQRLKLTITSIAGLNVSLQLGGNTYLQTTGFTGTP